MAVLTNTDPTDRTSLVGKTGDPVAGVPMDQAERRALGGTSLDNNGSQAGASAGNATPNPTAAQPTPVVVPAQTRDTTGTALGARLTQSGAPMLNNKSDRDAALDQYERSNETYDAPIRDNEGYRYDAHWFYGGVEDDLQKYGPNRYAKSAVGDVEGDGADVTETEEMAEPAADLLEEPKDALEEQAAFQESERERLYKPPVTELNANGSGAAPKTAQAGGEAGSAKNGAGVQTGGDGSAGSAKNGAGVQAGGTAGGAAGGAGGGVGSVNATAGAPAPAVTEEDDEEVQKTARQIELQQAYDAAHDAAESLALQPYKTQTPTRLSTYEDMFRAQHKDPTPTMDELMAEARRNRRNRIFASIGDFAAAVSNIGTTMAGAPNIEKVAGILPAYDANLKRLRELRNQDTALWEKGLQFAQQRDDKAYNTALQYATRAQGLEQKDRQMAINMYTRIAQNIEKAQEYEAKGDIRAAQLVRERARAEYEKAKSSKYGDLVDSQIKRNLDQGQAALIRASKTGSGSGSGKGNGKYPLTINGQTTYYNSSSDRAIAAQRYANEHGIEIESAGGGWGKPTDRDVVATVEAATNKKPAKDGGKKSGSQGGNTQKKKIGW